MPSAIIGSAYLKLWLLFLLGKIGCHGSGPQERFVSTNHKSFGNALQSGYWPFGCSAICNFVLKAPSIVEHLKSAGLMQGKRYKVAKTAF